MAVQRLDGDGGPEAELEDEAGGRQHASKASVPAYSDLTALPPALFLFRSLPTPAAQGDDPEKFKEPATRMMEPPGAARSDAQHLVGPVILLPNALVVAAIVFLATLA